jgi:hypothetical protein
VKKLLPTLAGLILLLGLPLLVNAMDAEELIAKHLEATGGAEKWQAVKSMRATGTVQVMGMELPFTVVQKRPNKMRIDSSMMGSPFVRAYDGENGWSINPMTGSQEPQDMPEVVEKIFAVEADLDGLLIGYEEKGYRVEYIGEDEVEGTPVHHLKVFTGDDMHFDMYFDNEYLLLIKQSRTFTLDESEMSEDTYYGDYQEFEGLVMPYSMEQRQGGQTVSQISVETVELGVDIADADFVKPAAEETVEEQAKDKSPTKSGG